jgi:hypothetical protein
MRLSHVWVMIVGYMFDMELFLEMQNAHKNQFSENSEHLEANTW